LSKIFIREVSQKLKLSASMLCFVLSACATGPASVPDTAIITGIQTALEEAIVLDTPPSDDLSEEDNDLLAELIPSLSLSEGLLAPVEERISISSPNLSADIFFNSLVADTEYGVVLSEDVEVNINLSLPNVTIEEAMDTVADIYNLDIERRGNIYSIRPGGLRTRQFTIDYLHVQRFGSSSMQIANAGGGQGGQGGQQGGIGGQQGGFGGQQGGIGGQQGGFGGQQGGQQGGLGGGGGGGAQGTMVSTTTTTDFWSDLETAITNLLGIQSSGNSGRGGGGAFGGLGGLVGLSGAGAGGAGAGNQSTVTEEGKSVLVQPLTGLIIVTAYPFELDKVENFIDAAQESLRREVIIQIQFLEVTLNKGFQYALDFNTFGQQANNSVTGSGQFRGDAEGLLGSNNDQAAQFLGAASGIQGIANPMQFTTNFSDFDAVFQLLQTRGTTQVISSPQLRVLNNQKAIFQDGDQEFFQTQADTTTVAAGDNTTTNAENNLEQFFSGISMDITPQISADGDITLHVHPTISAVDEQQKNIGGQIVPLARTSTREIDSVIKAANGKIVVLGGLAFERDVNQTAGVPGLSNVPVLGDVLEQRQTQTVKREFVILLKPIIANEAGDRKVLTESKDRFENINRAIDPFANN
jgi:MSHA biogenesis protein MshL